MHGTVSVKNTTFGFEVGWDWLRKLSKPKKKDPGVEFGP